MWAEFRGMDVSRPNLETAVETVPMLGVLDAKDSYDRLAKDTTTMGSTRSLAYTVGWMRRVFRRPRIMIKWTATENMFMDAGTKDMDGGQMASVMCGTP